MPWLWIAVKYTIYVDFARVLPLGKGSVEAKTDTWPLFR